MTVRFSKLIFSATCAAALLAQGSAMAQTGGATTAPAMSPATPAGSAMAGKLSSADRGMLRDMAEANMAEVASGQLALEKTQSGDVKQFAQMMVDDHGKALKDVQQLADAKGVTLPGGPSAKHKAIMLELKAISGSTFDKKYIAHAGLDDHKATLALLQKTQSHAKDADLKALAAKMTPVVQMHLQHAQEMAKM